MAETKRFPESNRAGMKPGSTRFAPMIGHGHVLLYVPDLLPMPTSRSAVCVVVGCKLDRVVGPAQPLQFYFLELGKQLDRFVTPNPGSTFSVCSGLDR